MDLSSLIGSLSDEDIAKLKETAAAVFSGDITSKQGKVNESTSLFSASNADMLSAAAKIGELFSAKDERSELLYALKPFLGETRRQKADQAAMMLKMLKIVDSVRRGG